ncbi:hypothetical protein E1J38_011705 [Seonamhaeicola sediminis]|uniref:DUF4251 domain-containing protein n=1 Tax=Seonamhaeicola sediminis TaxID=2528206 RepID=A0A562YCK6_9FLAO|nr:hypothetical protein [Seonamhaeicola sediminis]TWO32034.1 hypothetical protein E1J38_011705 [Seonamhaeicola sediminis]
MKILNYYSLLLVLCLVLSCGNNEKKETNQKTNSVVNKIKTGNNLVKGARDLAAESEALKKLTPISVETLKAFFPETIYGMPKTNSNALDMAGASMAFAIYGQNTSKQINIRFFDGAGEKGSAATASYRAIKYDKTNKEEYGDYTITKAYEDSMVKEHFDKGQNRYTLEFFYNGRFAVNLKVTGFEQKDVWPIFKEFKLNNLIK